MTTKGENHYERLRIERGVEHAEAFCRMMYQCRKCGRIEWLWNSRDGVTPFVVNSRCCNDEASHVHWERDAYRRDYVPGPGERFFRDGTKDEARAILRARIERAPMYAPPAGPKRDKYIEDILRDESSGEFQKGWPMIETVPAAPLTPSQREGWRLCIARFRDLLRGSDAKGAWMSDLIDKVEGEGR